MKIRCLVIDDEPLARAGIEKYVDQIDFLERVASCKSAIQANTFLQNQKIDLLFLDIEMPNLSGIDFLKSTRNAPYVIFTTAYPNYALEGYQFDVIDYLLKPISFERFLQAANKANRIIDTPSKEDKSDFIFVKTEKQLIKVKLDDILYIESMQNYIIIYTATEKIVTLVPMKNIFDMLDSTAFLQVHRSFIVAKAKVEAIVDNHIIIDTHRIPISNRMRKQVVDDLTGDRLLKK